MPALDCDMDETRKTFEVNVFGVMAVTKALAPLLIAAEGRIVMIGSLAGIMPYAFGCRFRTPKPGFIARKVSVLILDSFSFVQCVESRVARVL